MTLQDIQLMSRIAVSIVLEAAPFLLLGSLLSAAVDRYVDMGRIASRIPQGAIGRIMVGLLGGMLMPICECGSVPLARRLLEKGVPPLSAVTYMLAAPVINPVVVLSTYVAFSGNLQMVAGRVLAVAGSAALTGWLCRGCLRADRPADSNRSVSLPDLNHPHAHGAEHFSAGGRTCRMVLDLLSSGASEFLEMGKYLVLGALASAAFKVFL
ncbi:partial Putative two-component membrane permease complex subunit SMU_747c, partial [Anaerolineae bacterium]